MPINHVEFTMRKFSRTIEDQLLNLLGARRAGLFNGRAWEAAVPFLLGGLGGALLGMAFAPKAGDQLRKDAAKWMGTMRQEGMRQVANRTSRRAAGVDTNGDALDPGSARDDSHHRIT